MIDMQSVSKIFRTVVGGVLVVWVVGLLAVLIPARRAASISPAIATRAV